jgi:hypothetical protein
MVELMAYGLLMLSLSKVPQYFIKQLYSGAASFPCMQIVKNGWMNVLNEDTRDERPREDDMIQQIPRKLWT